MAFNTAIQRMFEGGNDRNETKVKETLSQTNTPLSHGGATKSNNQHTFKVRSAESHEHMSMSHSSQNLIALYMRKMKSVLKQ